MKDTDSSKGHSFSNEVKINLNVLGTLMLNGVGRHVYGVDIVTIDQGRLAERCVQLSQELAQPGSLSYGIGYSTILSFNTGAGDNVMPLGGLGDQVVPKENNIARCRLTSVTTIDPIGI